jgi:hypothetical protein
MTRRAEAGMVAFGALAGLAWAVGFRAWMSELAGFASRFDWAGTFGGIVVPGVVVGALLAWAEVLRRRGGPRGWRWLALAPLAFAIAPMLRPGAFADFLREGLGGGAIGVAVLAIAGGFAISGRGWLWARIVCGVLAAVLIVGTGVATFLIGGARLAVTEPRGVWAALLSGSFLVLLTLAASIPFRATTAIGAPHDRPTNRVETPLGELAEK